MCEASITWLGQGGYLIRDGATCLAIDPYLSNALFQAKGWDPGFDRMTPPPFLPDALRADAVIATHHHVDHLDAETLRPAEPRIGCYIGPGQCVEAFHAMGIPEKKIVRLQRGETMQVAALQITATYAAHTEDSIGVLIQIAGRSLYFVGDSLLDRKLLDECPQADILFCCINGRLGNMNAREAAVLAQALGVRIAVPCHYGLFQANTAEPFRFVDALYGSGITGRILDVGKSYPLHELWKG